jgi:phosphoribosylformylglycinamidine synthase subunit PurQ / glutaminase
MPHPERAADKSIGSTDGMAMFKGLLNSLVVA